MEHYWNCHRQSSGFYWNSRSIVNDQRHVEGTVTTADKGLIPVEINLVNEGGTWKIINLRPIPAGEKRESDLSTDDFND